MTISLDSLLWNSQWDYVGVEWGKGLGILLGEMMKGESRKETDVHTGE